jgi:hypothetical protein
MLSIAYLTDLLLKLYQVLFDFVSQFLCTLKGYGQGILDFDFSFKFVNDLDFEIFSAFSYFFKKLFIDFF